MNSTTFWTVQLHFLSIKQIQIHIYFSISLTLLLGVLLNLTNFREIFAQYRSFQLDVIDRVFG